MTKEIHLTQGYVALVDDEDHGWLSERSWCFNDGYAKSWIDGRVVRMHVLILGHTHDLEIDHANGNKLDNRRSNLRLASHSQNGANRPVSASKPHPFKGVYQERNATRWRALIQFNKHVQHIGYFDTPEDAARAYDAAARQYHGEFARLNFPHEVN